MADPNDLFMDLDGFDLPASKPEPAPAPAAEKEAPAESSPFLELDSSIEESQSGLIVPNVAAMLAAQLGEGDDTPQVEPIVAQANEPVEDDEPSPDLLAAPYAGEPEPDPVQEPASVVEAIVVTPPTTPTPAVVEVKPAPVIAPAPIVPVEVPAVRLTECRPLPLKWIAIGAGGLLIIGLVVWFLRSPTVAPSVEMPAAQTPAPAPQAAPVEVAPAPMAPAPVQPDVAAQAVADLMGNNAPPAVEPAPEAKPAPVEEPAVVPVAQESKPKPAPYPVTKPKPALKPAPKDRAWQDDALDQLDQLEKRL